MQSTLISAAEKMGVSLNAAQAQALIDFLQLILQWNKTYNLSSIRNFDEGLGKHLLDSLSILPYINSQKLLDIGSGAGLPGIVISIMRPDLAVSVLDSVGKKCRFMQFVKTQLGLKNLTIINSRVQDFQPEICFGQITSRAFAKMDKTLELSQHLLCDNGVYWFMKGANFQQERLPDGAKIHQLSVPKVSDERFLLEIRA